MNKNIKRIITLTLTISAFSAITPITVFDVTTKIVYAASYSPDDDELKSLTVKSIDGNILELRNEYNGNNVKLSENEDYYIKLTEDSDGIEINAKAEGDDYIVRIFTSNKADAKAYEPGEKIFLEKGDTTLYIRTYESKAAFRKAKDTQKDVTICEKEYNLNVKKTTESSYEDNTQDAIYLYNIECSRGNLNFIKGKTTYDMKVDSDVDDVKITAEPGDEDDRVRINGSLVESEDDYKKVVSLSDGKNEIIIKVTDDKDNQRTYTLNITKGDVSDAQDDIYLHNITISDKKLDFSKDKSSYKIDFDKSINKITIGAEPEDEEYLVKIDGREVNSDDDYEDKVSLEGGKNEVEVTVEDEINDKKRTYTLTINNGEAQEITNTDKTDSKTKGWIETKDGWKYNDENGNLIKNSWLYDKEQSVYCYFDEEGLRKTGWFKYKDKWYLLNEKGAMLTGWQDINGKRYLLDSSGYMKTGWYKEVVDKSNNNSSITNTTAATTTTKIENWYYLNDDGSMKTSWLNYGGNWYYLNTNGTMQKGWLIYSNSKYYLNEDGIMVTDTKTIDGKEYKFNTSGVLVI